jgi:hypothetical protein
MKFYKSVRRPFKYTESIHKETLKKAKKNEQENQKKLIHTGDKKTFVQIYNV